MAEFDWRWMVGDETPEKEESCLFTETTPDTNRVGWIVIGEVDRTALLPIAYESNSDAWCGISFKINIVGNFILGSPELIESPLDLEDIRTEIEKLAANKFIEKLKLDDNNQINFVEPYIKTSHPITWISSDATKIDSTYGICRDKKYNGILQG